MLFQVFPLVLTIPGIISYSLLDELPIGIGKVPWQASIQINGQHHCGGVIYSEDIILNIAECVRKANVKYISVRVGSSLKNLGGIVMNVGRIQAMGIRSSDVVILQLTSSLKLGANIQAIQLATSVPSPGTKATVSGWGQLSTLVPSSEILLRVHLKIENQVKCTAQQAIKGRLLNVDEICAAARGIVPLACQGFVGGPLVSGNKLVGIVSWHNSCDFFNTPSVFANIPWLKTWIDTTVRLMKTFNIG
ncbi:trypsin alpha-4 [Drosophila biarmipes]|uniref:trypsin alpha-4 n=1 Tax=Drosophila biarmipes TaxID=125945 RepID=UPI0007E6E08A|nr:trypsin alpha-4 [Drosophila biarmipes]